MIQQQHWGEGRGKQRDRGTRKHQTLLEGREGLEGGRGGNSRRNTQHYWRRGGNLGGGGTGLLKLTDGTSGGMNTVSSPRTLACWQHFLTIMAINNKAKIEIAPNHVRVPVDVTEYNLKDS
jgi:hypothetical protein